MEVLSLKDGKPLTTLVVRGGITGYKPYVPAYRLIDEYRPYQKPLYVKNSYNNDSLALLRYMQYQSDMTNLMMIHLNMMNRF